MNNYRPICGLKTLLCYYYGNKSKTFLLHPWQSLMGCIQIHENVIKTKLTLTKCQTHTWIIKILDNLRVFLFTFPSTFCGLFLSLKQMSTKNTYFGSACIFPAISSQIFNISYQKSELRMRTWRQHVSNDGQWRQYLYYGSLQLV